MGNEMVVVRKPENLELWRSRINDCRNSGKTVVDWCAEQGISGKTYYYWHRKLIKLQRMQAVAERPSFYEITGSRLACETVAATLHCNGVNADIYNGADEEILVRLCRALKQC